MVGATNVGDGAQQRRPHIRTQRGRRPLDGLTGYLDAFQGDAIVFTRQLAQRIVATLADAANGLERRCRHYPTRFTVSRSERRALLWVEIRKRSRESEQRRRQRRCPC